MTHPKGEVGEREGHVVLGRHGVLDLQPHADHGVRHAAVAHVELELLAGDDAARVVDGEVAEAVGRAGVHVLDEDVRAPRQRGLGAEVELESLVGLLELRRVVVLVQDDDADVALLDDAPGRAALHGQDDGGARAALRAGHGHHVPVQHGAAPELRAAHLEVVLVSRSSSALLILIMNRYRISAVLSCSHSRAWLYYAESVLHPQAFPALRCRSEARFRSGKCRDQVKAEIHARAERAYRSRAANATAGVPAEEREPTAFFAYMGLWARSGGSRGTYFLQTNDGFPFSRGLDFPRSGAD
ncbi:hypothetical protein FOCC_FOCC013286 [Frankliniella occidentalis]|nr:hypothetical protein FOCC_FOCC013286 [Frankliniella occidentalis]